MRWILWFLLIIALGVAFALFTEFTYGNVVVFWPPYRLDFSVNVAVVGLMILFGVGWALLFAANRLISLPTKVQAYQKNRRELTGAVAFRDAVLALFEGRFGRAERLSEIALSNSTFSTAASLVAARASHRLRAFDRRDRWLANDDNPSNAHLMTMAELAIEERSDSAADEAIAAVKSMQARGARHIHAQRTALRAYEIKEDWPEVIRLCRVLYKRQAIHPTASRGLLSRAHRQLFKAADNDLTQLRQHWSKMSSAEQSWPEVVEPAALAFAQAGDAAMATKLIAKRLDENFSANAVELYSELEVIPAKERLQRLERLMEKVGPEPVILKALGRVCLALKLWGKAEDCLKRSVKDQPSVDSLLLLADVYEQTDRLPQASDIYRQAAKLSAQVAHRN